MAPLDGGIKLKDRQKLLGVEPARGARPVSRLTNTTAPGDAVTLAHGNEVAHLHIAGPAGAAILGDNVNGAILRDLLVTERSPIPRSQLDPSLCRVVRTGGAVDNALSVLRGCTGNQVTGMKGAIVLLADDRAGAAALTYTLQRVMIQDSPSHETPEFLWPAGVQVLAAGRVTVTLDLIDSSIEFTVRGLSLRGMRSGSRDRERDETWFTACAATGSG